MDVDAFYVGEDSPEFLEIRAMWVSLEEVGYCGAKKASRAATGIQHGLVAPLRQELGYYQLAQPVRRIVLAEIVPVFGINELLVDALEYVLVEPRQVVLLQVRNTRSQ